MPSPAELLLHRRYWQRSILIPLWTQQLLLQLCGVVFFWYAISIFWVGGPSHGSPLRGGGSKGEQAILATLFLLYLSLLLATLGEMLLYSAGVLRPKGYLLSQVLKTLASVAVWGDLVLYPFVIKDPITSRKQVAICMEAVFAWLQIPMLSSLIHALLVWREEIIVNREIREQEASAADAGSFSGATSVADVSLMSEVSPLLAGRVIGYNGRKYGASSRPGYARSPTSAC